MSLFGAPKGYEDFDKSAATDFVMDPHERIASETIGLGLGVECVAEFYEPP